VRVRLGWQAKRGKAEGVALPDRALWDDAFGHRSCGPRRSGRAVEGDVLILSHERDGSMAVVIYALER
jgi:hypothetical protein